jgi:hypothetical protein
MRMIDNDSDSDRDSGKKRPTTTGKAIAMPHITDRFQARKWGVFTHYLYSVQNNPESEMNRNAGEADWSRCADELNVETVVNTLAEVGAGYHFFTLMQGRKYMAAPNATFDRIAGCAPGTACSRRDVPLDLHKALSRHGIDLYLYFTGDGPYKDEREGRAFGFVEPRSDGVTLPFVRKWAAVLEEYAVRYGGKVNGWWIDGCYSKHFKYTEGLLQHYVEACRKGNPRAVVALNDGVKEDLEVDFPNEDFTCGEFNDFTVVPESRFIGGVQTHILAPLGTSPDGSEWNGWCKPGSKRSREYMLDYVRRVNDAGGVVTIDVALYRDGSFDPAQVEVLKYIGDHLT